MKERICNDLPASVKEIFTQVFHEVDEAEAASRLQSRANGTYKALLYYNEAYGRACIMLKTDESPGYKTAPLSLDMLQQHLQKYPTWFLPP